MTAHWIEVNDGKWKMRAAVISFKAISGSHTGENLGQYTVGLLDRVWIMDKKKSKACCNINSISSITILSISSSHVTHSFTQRPSTTQVTMTQHARPWRIFIVVAALSGIGKSNSYHEFHVHIFFLIV